VKQEICRAFCDSVTVTELPCGFGRSETQASEGVRPLVFAMLERENAVSKHTRTRAHNRLDAVGIYEGDEKQAVAKVVQFVTNAPRIAA
jgi:hypothetical protein